MPSAAVLPRRLTHGAPHSPGGELECAAFSAARSVDEDDALAHRRQPDRLPLRNGLIDVIARGVCERVHTVVVSGRDAPRLGALDLLAHIRLAAGVLTGLIRSVDEP